MPWHRTMTGAETQTATRKQEGAAIMPPRLRCALGAAEVQDSRNLDVVYTQVNEHYFLFARYARTTGQTREPGDETARAGKSTRRPGELARNTRHSSPGSTVLRPPKLGSTASRFPQASEPTHKPVNDDIIRVHPDPCLPSRFLSLGGQAGRVRRCGAGPGAGRELG